MRWKEFLKTPKGRLTAALCVLGISWIFLFFYFVGPVNSLLPGKDAISDKQDTLKKLQKENSTLKQKMKQHKALEQRYAQLLEESWQTKDGFIEIDLRTKVQTAAQKAQLNLNSLGSVKMVKINNDLSYAEIDLQGSAPIEVIATFLTQIDGMKPKLYWKRFDLRMDMRSRRNNQQETAMNLSLNGTLRVIYSGKKGGNP